MHFWTTYPLITHPHNPAFVTGDALARISRGLEEAGFSGIGFTDHPAPTDRWLRAGGHDALDPLVALSYCAASTEQLRLIPNILVLPYRNPFLTAKAVATLDALSGGRFTLAVATGYLRGEYRALGVDFEERNALFDEAIEVIDAAWSTDNYHHVGSSFEAKGQSINPKPARRPPVWIGGNSLLSRRRVAKVGDGWNPFRAPRELAQTAKTPPLVTAADLAAMLDELWGFVEAEGRDPGEIDVSFGTSAGGSPAADEFDADAHLEGLTELARLGVTWVPVEIPGDDVGHALEAIARYGEHVIARCKHPTV
jgi:probable F420-dependent oxidoreductase